MTENETYKVLLKSSLDGRMQMRECFVLEGREASQGEIDLIKEIVASTLKGVEIIHLEHGLIINQALVSSNDPETMMKEMFGGGVALGAVSKRLTTVLIDEGGWSDSKRKDGETESEDEVRAWSEARTFAKASARGQVAKRKTI